MALAANAASGNAFSELTEGGQQASTATTPTTPKTVSTASTTTTSNTNTSGVLLLGLIAAGALITGIAFMILRDARRVAPVPDGQMAAGRPARDVAAMMRKRRAKAKAARRQRKRNR